MHQWLGSLPFDVLFWIASYLDVEDVVHLHNTSRQLRFLLDEETLCRKLLENRASLTLEAKQAPQNGYASSLRRLYKRRTAVARGKPASVASFSFAADAIYTQGVVCYLEQTHVRILDLYGPTGERCFTIRSLLGPYAQARVSYDWECLQLLSYSCHALIFKFSENDSQNWLMAVDISQEDEAVHLMEPERLQSTHSLFALQQDDYLFYGTRSARRACGKQSFREWIVQGIALRGKTFNIGAEISETAMPTKSESIRFHGFAGAELGSTAAFKIHQGYFYAVTNYDSFDVIEVDFTSYYHCIRFPVDRAQQSTCEASRTIFRRQHMDGPVNDGWNALELQVDERTETLVIVEGRAEWPSASGQLSHGVYTHRLNWEELELETVEDRQPQAGPVGNPLSKIPDLETKYCPTPVLPHWYDHLEMCHPSTHPSATTFTLARSKFRGYNLTTMATLQLIELPCTCRGVDGFCLHLKSMSRTSIPLQPVDNVGKKGKAIASHDQTDLQAQRAASYRYSPMSLWPMQDSGTHSIPLHLIMNLPGHVQKSRSAEVRVWMDERSIVYFISDGGIGKVVCLNFDGDAPVARMQSHMASTQLNIIPRPRGRSPCHESDPEHTRQISPARAPWDQPKFDPQEMRPGYFESTLDLEDIEDADRLGPEVLERWFTMLDAPCDVEMANQ